MKLLAITVTVVIMSGLGGVRMVVAADKSAPAKPGAQEIIKKMLDKYHSLTSYEGLATEVQVTKIGARENKVTIPARIIYKKPNKFVYRIESASPQLQRQSGCDGKTLWAFVPAAKEYTNAPAPKDLNGLEKTFARTTMDPLAFLRGEDPVDEARDLRQLPDTKLDNKPMSQIAFTRSINASGGTIAQKIEMLIGKDDSLLYKTTQHNIIESHGMKVDQTSTETHTGVKVNADIPDKTFKFTPPKDAKLVKKFTPVMRPPGKFPPGKTPGNPGEKSA